MSGERSARQPGAPVRSQERVLRKEKGFERREVNHRRKERSTTMKKAILGLAAGLLFTFVAGAVSGDSASADNGPHMASGAGATADGCAGCHRAHTATGSKLLVQAQPALCITCHGTGGTGAVTNVTDGTKTGGAAGDIALRGGGFSNARIDGAAATGKTTSGTTAALAGATIPVRATAAATTSGHLIDGITAGRAWGNGTGVDVVTTTTLSCGSCHDPHGNSSFRVLRGQPTLTSGQSTGAAVGIADSTSAKVYTTANYWTPSSAETGNTFIANVSSWCSTCHTKYNSGTTNTDGAYQNRHRSNVTTDNAPTCAQCHVAHGSNVAMGTQSAAVKDPGGATLIATQASRLLRIDNRGICQMCHNK